MLGIGREVRRKLIRVNDTCKLVKVYTVHYEKIYNKIRNVNKSEMFYFTFNENTYLLYNNKVLFDNIIIAKYDTHTNVLFTFNGSRHNEFVTSLLQSHRNHHSNSLFYIISYEIHKNKISTYTSDIPDNKKEGYIKAAIELL